MCGWQEVADVQTREPDAPGSAAGLLVYTQWHIYMQWHICSCLSAEPDLPAGLSLTAACVACCPCFGGKAAAGHCVRCLCGVTRKPFTARGSYLSYH